MVRLSEPPSNVELSQIQLSGQRAANMADTIAQQSALSVPAGAPREADIESRHVIDKEVRLGLAKDHRFG